jgi:hypothetical protein
MSITHIEITDTTYTPQVMGHRDERAALSFDPQGDESRAAMLLSLAYDFCQNCPIAICSGLDSTTAKAYLSSIRYDHEYLRQRCLIVESQKTNSAE